MGHTPVMNNWGLHRFLLEAQSLARYIHESYGVPPGGTTARGQVLELQGVSGGFQDAVCEFLPMGDENGSL